MNFMDLDTPSLIIDLEKMIKNIETMQKFAYQSNVDLRPHTKTHKMPALAKLQLEKGCKGITVAKLGEAEVMAENGIDDIFIANQIVGEVKLERARELSEKITLSFGVDSPEHVILADKIFAKSSKPANILIEIEVGEERSGIIEEADFVALLETIKKCPNVEFRGIFSHEGHSYNSDSIEACLEEFDISQKRTLKFAEIAKNHMLTPKVVSIGATPSMLLKPSIMEGITEIRPGTYILMDASMSACLGTLENCAATVLTTVISRPTLERVITDVGAKGLTAQRRTKGITATQGVGTIKGNESISVFDVYDEHAIIYDREFRDKVSIGDKLEIYPVHICPVCNLYESAFLVSNGEIIDEIPILCRGKLK